MEYWDEKSLEYKYQMTQVFEKLPEFIQKIVEKLFNNNVLSLFSFKHDYDPEERKANQEFVRKHNLFNKREMKIPQNEKLIIARKQMELLKNNKSFNNLEYIENKVPIVKTRELDSSFLYLFIMIKIVVKIMILEIRIMYIVLIVTLLSKNDILQSNAFFNSSITSTGIFNLSISLKGPFKE